MSYYQQIQYVDYCKDGERFHNGGFVKAIKDGNHQKVDLHITCRDEGIQGEYPIWMIPETEKNKSFSLGTILLRDGTGLYSSDRVGGEEKEDVTMKIYLGQGRVLETLLKECLLPKELENEAGQIGEYREESVTDTYEEESMEHNEMRQGKNHENNGKGIEEGGDIQKYEQDNSMDTWIEGGIKDYLCEETVEEENTEAENLTIDEKLDTSGEVEVENRKKEDRKEEAGSIRIADTKWEQIEKIYPKKSPFEDERSYILFAPEDFLLLRQDCYGLIRNSFLQHGYSNYKELVLWKGEQNRFYIGVPGIYDRQECQAAVYFGFERFECKEEPPKQGEVGYYMKRVYL